MPANQPSQPVQRQMRRSRGIDPTIDPHSVELDHRLTLANRQQSPRLGEEVKEAFMRFLREAPLANKDVIKYKILGNLVACIRWDGEFWLSSGNLVTIQLALLQLQTNLQTPRDRRRISDYILTMARGNKNADVWEVFEADSPQLRHLYLNGAVKNLKRQRVFRWERINHEQLHAEVIARFGQNKQSPYQPKFNRRLSETDSWASSSTTEQRPTWTMTMISPPAAEFKDLSVLIDAVEMLEK